MRILKHVSFLLATLLLIVGCQQNPGKQPDATSAPEATSKQADPMATDQTEQTASPFFKAQGNEPFWNISLGEQEIIFTSLVEGYEALTTPLPEMIRAADANVKLYRAETEKVTLNMTISQGDCADTMADMVYAYTVEVQIKLTGDDSFKVLKGCGNYLPDYRLHDTWVLEKLGAAELEDAWFANEPPHMEIDTKQNTFVGYAGCNQMRGKIFWEPGLIRFTDAITTRKACGPENREGEFLNALAKATTYTIKNNRLHLLNPDGPLLVFKKID